MFILADCLWTGQGITSLGNQLDAIYDRLTDIEEGLLSFQTAINTVNSTLQGYADTLNNWNPTVLAEVFNQCVRSQISTTSDIYSMLFRSVFPSLDTSVLHEEYNPEFRYYRFARGTVHAGLANGVCVLDMFDPVSELDFFTYFPSGVKQGYWFELYQSQPPVYSLPAWLMDYILSYVPGMSHYGGLLWGTIAIPKTVEESSYTSSDSFDFINDLLSGINIDNYYQKFAGTLAIPAATLPALGGVLAGGGVAVAMGYIVTDLVAKFAAISSAPKIDLLLAFNLAQLVGDAVEQFKNDRERHQQQQIWDLLVAGRFPDGNLFEQYDVYRDGDWWPFDEPVARRCSHWENRSIANALNFGCEDLVPSGQDPDDEQWKVIKVVEHWLPGLDPPTCNYAYFKKVYPFTGISQPPQVFYLPEEFNFFFPLWFGKGFGKVV